MLTPGWLAAVRREGQKEDRNWNRPQTVTFLDRLSLVVVPSLGVPVGKQNLILDEGQDRHRPSHTTAAIQATGWQVPPSRVVVLKRQTDLLQMIQATGASRRFTCLLHGWQQQSHQDTNNGDHNQQFDEREAGLPEKAKPAAVASGRDGAMRS